MNYNNNYQYTNSRNGNGAIRTIIFISLLISFIAFFQSFVSILGFISGTAGEITKEGYDLILAMQRGDINLPTEVAIIFFSLFAVLAACYSLQVFKFLHLFTVGSTTRKAVSFFSFLFILGFIAAIVGINFYLSDLAKINYYSFFEVEIGGVLLLLCSAVDFILMITEKKIKR